LLVDVSALAAQGKASISTTHSRSFLVALGSQKPFVCHSYSSPGFGFEVLLASLSECSALRDLTTCVSPDFVLWSLFNN
jgi:hypothetical protein